VPRHRHFSAPPSPLPLELIEMVQTAFDSIVAWVEYATTKPGLTSVRFGVKNADGTSRAHSADERAMWLLSKTMDYSF